MIGRTLAHYEITGLLGKGGMGEVYRARDTRLKRDVALKVLPPEMAGDPTRLQRFQREAETVAGLNHPHIVTMFSVEQDAGVRFLTMELVEGRRLDEILRAGTPPLKTVLDIGIAVADALATAHAKGIVHRDLKPGNVMLTADGRVKVLDFGLAKLLESGEGPIDQTLANDPTHEGAIVGTMAYMSPEQAEGRSVDHRADVFALGIMLYEMLSGRHPFRGASNLATLSSILKEEPTSLEELAPETPHRLAQVTHRCLEKLPDRRYNAVLDLRNDLQEVRAELSSAERPPLATPGAGRSGPGRRSRTWLPAVVIAVVSIGILGVWLQRRASSPDAPERPSPPAREASPVVSLRQVTSGAGIEEYPAFSPDGIHLAYCEEVDGYRQVFVKHLETDEVRQITSEERDHIQPAWAADGGRLLVVRARDLTGKLEPGDIFGVYTDGDVWEYDLESNESRSLIRDAYNPAVATDGHRIAFDASWGGQRHIWVADEEGRNARQLTAGRSEGESHVVPRWSFDGTRVAFQRIESTKFDIEVVDVATQATIPITEDAFKDLNPVWSRSGRDLYFSSYRGGGMNVWRMPLAEDGTPQGPPRQVTAGAGQDVQLAMSPTGTSLAMTILNINADLWRLPVSPATGQPTGPPQPLTTTTREESRGAWSPDGTEVAFNSDRGGQMNVWIHSLEGGQARQVTDGPGGDFQPRWSSDGDRLVFFSSRAGNADIWTVRVASGELSQLTSEPSLEINPFYSPDGRFIAFQSDRGGRKEVWLMTSEGEDPRRLTNTGVGDHFMLWSADSRHVIFSGWSDAQYNVAQVDITNGEVVPFANIRGGAHMSFSPDRRRIADSVGHKSLWTTALDGEESWKVFEFEDPDVRIDYPTWSPDGKWILFDRWLPRGGDIWLVTNLEP